MEPGVFVVVLLPLAMAILRALFPRIVLDEPLSDAERKRFGKIDRRGLLLWPVAILLFTYPLGLLLQPLAGVLAPTGPSEFVLIEDGPIWFAGALILVIFGTPFVTKFFVMRTLGRDYFRYRAFQDEKAKMNSDKVVLILSSVIFTPVLAFMLFICAFSMRVTADSITTTPGWLFSVPEFRFDEVEKIEVERGRKSRVTLRDGRVWTDEWVPTHVPNAEFIQLIADRSGVTPVEVETKKKTAKAH